MRSKLKLGWDGKQYDLLVTMDIVEKIDEEFGLAQSYIKLASGQMRETQANKIICFALNLAGCDVTRDQLWESIYTGESEIEPQELMRAAMNIIIACYPVVEGDQPKKRKPRKRS